MKTLVFIFSILHGFFDASILSAQSNPKWEKISEDSDVVVYSMLTPDNPIVTVKGEGVVDESMDRIVNLLLDYTKSKEWVEYLVEVQVPKRWSRDEFLYYSHFRSPFFFIEDRDFLTHIKVERSPGAVKISTHSTDEIQIEHKDRIRGYVAKSSMELKAINSNQTFFTATLQSDPKGSIPLWIVNYVLKRFPINSFRSIKKQLKKMREQEEKEKASQEKPASK